MQDLNFNQRELAASMNFANTVKLILHVLWATVLVLWVIPNSVEIIRILVASNG